MSVSSLSPWLSDFHAVRFSVSSGYFLYLNCCCPSFGCARRQSVPTYASILAISSGVGKLFKIPNNVAVVRQPGTSYFAGETLSQCNIFEMSSVIILDSAFRNLSFKYQSTYIRIHV